jgi:glycosyltransferase involved in cell wall biosynthesis
MRILHLIRSADPAGGGPIEAVTHLALEHRRHGRHVEVVTLDDPRAAWCRTFPLPLHPLGPVWTKYGYTRRLLPWLLENRRRFDVMVANGLWQYTSFAAWRASGRCSMPYVVFPHGMLDPWFKRRYPLKHLKKLLYWPWAEYRVLRDAAAVFFTSQEEMEQAAQSFWMYQCRPQVIPYGTAAPPDDESRQREAFFDAFPALRDKQILLFLGRVHEKKGCDLIVEAIAQLREQRGERPRHHLVLAGPVSDISYARRLRERVARLGLSESVTWTGMLTGDRKWGAFRAADVFVLPSHQENFGIAVVEAMACGLPVLISRSVNIWREVVADQAGFAETDSGDGTRRLLMHWISLDQTTRNRIRANARRCFDRRFNVRMTSERVTRALEAVA